jgi:hypothetical protein
MSGDIWLNEMITVCDKCLTASCYQGIFVCQSYKYAGIVQKSRSELLELGKEHQDYMKTDEELARG